MAPLICEIFQGCAGKGKTNKQKHSQEAHFDTCLHARGSSIVQAGVFLVVGGVDVGALVLPLVQLRSGPHQDELKTLCPPLFVLIRPWDSGLQSSLWGQDLGPHAEEVQRRLIVHVPLVRVPIFAEEERSKGMREGGKEGRAEGQEWNMIFKRMQFSEKKRCLALFSYFNLYDKLEKASKYDKLRPEKVFFFYTGSQTCFYSIANKNNITSTLNGK